MKSKVMEFLSFLSIVFLLILMMNSSINYVYNRISMSDYAMYIYINGGIGLVLYIISKIKNFKFNKYEIIVFILALLSCLSLINAVNINVAIFGMVNRNEGLLVWLTYYILILNAMNIKNKKYLYFIISLFAIYMLINWFYGLYQVGVFDMPTLFKVRKYGYYASGFLGNSNFFGTLSVIFYGLVIGVFIKTKIGLKKYLLAIVLLVANLSIIMSGAMSALVGVIAINIISLIVIIVRIIKKKENRFVELGSLIIGILSFVLVFFTYTVNHQKIINDILQIFNQVQTTVNTRQVEESYGSGRIFIWQKTIEKMKEEPITGYGIDNVYYAFGDGMYDKERNNYIDKVHNDYLQKAFCEGIIAGVIFVVFLLMIFFKGIFSKLSPAYYGLLMAFTGYSVVSFFSFGVIRVAPIYFIIIGLLIGGLKKEKSPNLEEKESRI